MRRLAVLGLAAAAATAAVLTVTVAPAWAHICPISAQIAVGQSSTVDVGVTVEGATVSDVEIELPSGLTLDHVDPKPGWTFVRTGPTVRYRGGPIEAFTCEYFSIGVTAPSRGSFGVTVIQRTANGAVVAQSIPDPNSYASRVLDQFVYAGVTPPKAPSTSGGLPTATIAGGALVALAIVMFGVVRFRARRGAEYDDDGDGDGDEADREAELQARLERFRTRTADRPIPR